MSFWEAVLWAIVVLVVGNLIGGFIYVWHHKNDADEMSKFQEEQEALRRIHEKEDPK